MKIFIENEDQSIRFVKRFRVSLDNYWKLENTAYFEFIEYLENKYDIELNFYGESDEVGYVINTDDRKMVKNIFEEFKDYVEKNI